MGRNDHAFYLQDNDVKKVKCSHCGKFYVQYLEDQVIGNRSKDEDICPYCKYVNGCSMDYEFHNSKIE